VSLLDVVPTCLSLAGAAVRPAILDGHDLTPLLRGETASVRDCTLFTYDDHQAGTALQNASGQPNRIRCVRAERFKYAVYADPQGRAAPEFELYDLEADPLEAHNLVEKRSGRTHSAAHERERARLALRLSELCEESGTLSPQLPE
jgi:arylsulfatase A-like enzyme